MIELGKIQTLKIVKTTDFGVYLAADDNELVKVLLPKKQVPADSGVGSEIEVFIYKDSEDRLIATTIAPKIELNKLAVLEVIEVGTIGAFLDWGLAKDLLLPFREQTHKVHVGDNVLVSLYIDKSNRLCATMKVYHFLSTNSPYKKDDVVTGVIYEFSNEFGAFVAVDNKFSALIPKKNLFQMVETGSTIEARVTEVKEDGKLTLNLGKKAYLEMDEVAEAIFKKLQDSGGFLPFNDKSDPQAIKKEFMLSKASFKRSVGRLFKERRIRIEDDGIYINQVEE